MKNKRILACALVIIVMISTMVIPVYAADSNHTDTDFEFDIYFSSYNNKADIREKCNTTPVYMWIQSITDGTALTCVCIQGIKYNSSGDIIDVNSDLTMSNGAFVPYVSCDTQKYSIHTYLYESKYYACRPVFKSGGPTITHISGVWSPDSKGTYQDAVKY